MTWTLPRFDEAAIPVALGADLPPAAQGAVAIKDEVDDFRVDEEALYPALGEGEHLYLQIEKRGVSTPDMLRRIGRRFRLNEREVGVAGLKDARGVTSQWISVPARAVEAEVAAIAELGPLRVLQAVRHRNKLRMGHLKANRFTIRLRGAVDVDVANARIARLAQGFPNAFGGQRYGPGSASLDEAVRFVSFRRPARSRKDRFLVSVVQSAIFDAWLRLRVAEGTWLRALLGDVLVKSENGAPFSSTDPDTDTQRIAAGEVSVAGPLMGTEMRPAGGEALTCESRLLASLSIDVPELLGHPAFQVGARRVSRVWADAISVTPADDGAVFAFSLPPGSYATVFLRNCLGAPIVDTAPTADLES